MRKYQKVEDLQVLSPEEHQRLEKALHSQGKTSAKMLSPTELKRVNQVLEE